MPTHLQLSRHVLDLCIANIRAVQKGKQEQYSQPKNKSESTSSQQLDQLKHQYRSLALVQSQTVQSSVSSLCRPYWAGGFSGDLGTEKRLNESWLHAMLLYISREEGRRCTCVPHADVVSEDRVVGDRRSRCIEVIMACRVHLDGNPNPSLSDTARQSFSSSFSLLSEPLFVLTPALSLASSPIAATDDAKNKIRGTNSRRGTFETVPEPRYDRHLISRVSQRFVRRRNLAPVFVHSNRLQRVDIKSLIRTSNHELNLFSTEEG
ncbi:hypothetical protein KCV00_g391, partial [Aureobasidium melanogenum]